MLRKFAPHCFLLTFSSAASSVACAPVDRPWNARLTDARADVPQVGEVATVDAPRHDAALDTPPLDTPPLDTPPLDTPPHDATSERADDVARPDVGPDLPASADAADATTITLGANGCSAAETEAAARVWSILTTHALSPSEAFRACATHAVFSATPAGFFEEIHNRLRSARPRESLCSATPAAGSDAHDLVAVSDPSEPLQITFARGALTSVSPVRVAAAVLHQMLHHDGYDHYGTGENEAPWGVPYVLERCLRVVAEPGPLDAMMSRDQMSVAAELQPFGTVRPSGAADFYTECPPGTWVSGEGLGLTPISGSNPHDRVTALGLRCRPRPTGTSVDVGARAPMWADCGPGRVAVGVTADANVSGLYSLRVRCVDWANVHTPAAEATPVSLPRRPGGYVIERRCPPGQALVAASGSVDSSGWILALALHCHHVDRRRVGGYRALPAIGASSFTGTRTRRMVRCADQGVITSLVGHRRTSTGDFARFGAVCRSTEWRSGALRFRTVGQGADERLVPEHPIPTWGGDPREPVFVAVPFESLPDAPRRNRCPDGMGLVGIRVRRAGSLRAPQHLQGLCAPLDAWMRTPAPAPTPMPVVGTVDDPTAPDVETALCSPGHFASGLEAQQFAAPSPAFVVDRFTLLCRDMREAL